MSDPAGNEAARPKWLGLLEYSSKRLSVPFVIGALRETGAIRADEEDFEQVYRLFHHMATYQIQDDRVVYVRECPDLRVPVFSILGHLWGDVLALFVVAAVLAFLTPRVVAAKTA